MELSQDPKIVQLRQEMLQLIDRATAAAYAYYGACDVGPERTWGGNVHEILHRATREARE